MNIRTESLNEPCSILLRPSVLRAAAAALRTLLESRSVNPHLLLRFTSWPLTLSFPHFFMLVSEGENPTVVSFH